MSSAPSQVAAFDFDGTLARGDSLLPFLLRLLGGRRVARSLLRHSVSIGMVGAGRANRDIVKERFIAHVLEGHSAGEATTVGREFALDHLSTRLFPSMRGQLDWHREQGHRLVLVSASLDIYLAPIAEQLGFDDLLCTTLEIVDGRVTGKLVGVNVRADEKARQLRNILGSDHELWAYGNSDGDVPMLEMATYPYWVDKKGGVSPWQTRR